MAVFDDIKQILQDINDKLGVGGTKPEDGFKILDDLKPKLPDDKGGIDYNRLESSFAHAFGQIPIFGQISKALSGLTPILRDLGVVLLAQGGHTGLKSVLSTAKIQEQIASARQSLFNLRNTPVDGVSGLPPPLPGEEETVVRGVGINRTFKKAQLSGLAQEIAGKENELKSIQEQLHQNSISGKAGALGKNIIQPWIKSGSGAVLTAGELGAMALLPLAAAGVGIALTKFAASLYESTRAMGAFNGSLQWAGALHDLTGTFLDAASANRRQGSAIRFQNTMDDFLIKVRPVLDELANFFLDFGTGFIQGATALLEGLKNPKFRDDVVDKATDAWLPWRGAKWVYNKLKPAPHPYEMAHPVSADDRAAHGFAMQAEELAKKIEHDNLAKENLRKTMENLATAIKQYSDTLKDAGQEVMNASDFMNEFKHFDFTAKQTRPYEIRGKRQ